MICVKQIDLHRPNKCRRYKFVFVLDRKMTVRRARGYKPGSSHMLLGCLSAIARNKRDA